MRIAELVAAGLFTVAFVMYLFIIPGSSVLLILTLGLLSMLYFYFGFAIFNGIRLRKLFKKESYAGISAIRIIGAVCTGIALSIMAVGLLFKLLSWPGAMVNLMAGCIILSVISAIGFTRYMQNKSVYYVRIFQRAAVFGGLGIVLLLLPSAALIDFRYRNHPAYRDALKNSVAHPDNPELWKKARGERDKMDQTP